MYVLGKLVDETSPPLVNRDVQMPSAAPLASASGDHRRDGADKDQVAAIGAE